MAVIGLLLGCGGDKGTEMPKGDDKKGGGASGGQGSAHTKLRLAEFLPNKRIYVEVEMRDGEGEAEGEAENEAIEAPGIRENPPADEGESPISTAKAQPMPAGTQPMPAGKKIVALQFEKDGKFYPAENSQGKWVSMKNDLTYKVTGSLQVTVYEAGKEDGGVTFPNAKPKKGDTIKVGPRNMQFEATITKIEAASPLASGDTPADELPSLPGDPDENRSKDK